MSRPRNKFERREANRRRLERLYDSGANEGYPACVEFHAKEPDWRQEHTDYKYYKGPIAEDDGSYKYWHRPDSEYYIIERDYYAPHAGRESYKKFLKKQANRRLRRADELYQRCSYKKVYDLWWTLW